MSTNNDEQKNNRREFNDNFSIFRNNFLINSCKNQNISNRNRKFNDNSFESVESMMFKRKINGNNGEKKLINNRSMMNLKPIYNRKKNDFYINKNFKVNPGVEEIPTFSYENDLNVKSFRSFMNKRSEMLRQNYDNFMKYMRQHENERRKKQLISPYCLYIKKINDVKKYEEQTLPKLRQKEISNLKMNFNRYDEQNDFNNNYNYNSFSTSNRNKPYKFDLNNYLEEISKNKEKEMAGGGEIEIEKSKEKEIEYNNENLPYVSNSINDNKKYFPKNNEISNPELFYKKGNREFQIYRKEQKKFDDYNYKLILLHNKNRFIKKEPDINPFNPKVNLYKIGNSSLPQNVILRPGDCYGNFKNTFKYLNNYEN